MSVGAAGVAGVAGVVGVAAPEAVIGLIILLWPTIMRYLLTATIDSNVVARRCLSLRGSGTAFDCDNLCSPSHPPVSFGANHA